MRCPEIRAFLHPFLDGELDVEKNVVVLQHLELCGCCRDRFEGEKRLLVRVREGLGERCPDALRRRIFEACAAVPCGESEPPGRALPVVPGRARAGRGLPWKRYVASAAAAAAVFLVIDPLCLFGCSAVRALTSEVRKHQSEPLALNPGTSEELSASLSKITGTHVPVPHFCPGCCGKLACEGGEPVKVGDAACLIRFRDEARHTVTFVQVRGIHLHPMLLGQDGLYVAHEGDSCFVGWADDAGEICGLVADVPTTSLERLVALAANVRAQEHH